MSKFWALALMGMVLGTSTAWAENETIRIGADLTYPPFQYREADGSPHGFEIDITNAVCKAVSVKCEFVVSSFDAEIPSLLAKKVDVISPLGATEKRKKAIDFSDFVYHIPTQLVVRKGSGLLPDITSLQGKHIAVQQGTIQEMFANQFWATKGIDIVPYADQDMIYQDLAAGRLDGALSPAVAITFGFLNKPEGKDFTLSGPEVRDDKIFSIGSAYGFRKGDDRIKTLLNDGLAKIKADGTWEKIKEHYFGALDLSVRQSEQANAAQ